MKSVFGKTVLVRVSCYIKFGDKERFDKEQIGVKEPFPVTNVPVYFIRIRNIWHLIRNNFCVTKKFLIKYQVRL